MDGGARHVGAKIGVLGVDDDVDEIDGIGDVEIELLFEDEDTNGLLWVVVELLAKQ